MVKNLAYLDVLDDEKMQADRIFLTTCKHDGLDCSEKDDDSWTDKALTYVRATNDQEDVMKALWRIYH